MLKIKQTIETIFPYGFDFFRQQMARKRQKSVKKKKKKNVFRAHMEYESARQPIEKQMTVGNVKRHVR